MKETLKKERNESQNLKIKYEDMISEIEVSKAECQTLQSNKDALVLSTSNIEKDIRGNLGSKMGLIRKCAKISFCELEFKNQ